MQRQPHILILPFPVQGHIKPMLCLAEFLCNFDLHVTFVNTQHNHQILLKNLQSLSNRFPTLHFESISDGLGDNQRLSRLNAPRFISSIMSVTKPLFRDWVVSFRQNSDDGRRPPVTCIIADGIMSFAIDVAEELGIKSIAFRTFSACSLWLYCCIPMLIEAGQLPFADDNMDANVTNVPGMESLLRRRDLPGICRTNQLDNPVFQFFISQTKAMTRASSLILNTFDDLEAPILSHIASVMPKIYTIGPLHAHLKSRMADSNPLSSTSSSLWTANRTCITWLDSQPLKSVIYVSFGSFVVMTCGELLEFYHGLVNSGKPFLWVLRSDIIIKSEEEEEEENSLKSIFNVGPKEMGFVVNWAPQEEVLAHPAVGGFLSHGGWNSTLEAIVAGVPLICWPRLGDQQVNSRYISEVWRIGLDMKDTCDRSTVERMIRTLMEDRREEIIRSMDRISGLARDSVNPGGSSYQNLNQLIEDLRWS